MKILLIGAGGMLARALAQTAAQRGGQVVGLDLPAFDLTDEAQVKAAVTAEYDVVLNASAYTNVDAAESDEARATLINGQGVAYLADACAARGVPLLHYSTDYVFAGNASTPYRVDEPLAPLGAYGRSKAVGEHAIRAAGADHLILRTSWLYAPWANNFVRTIYRHSRLKASLGVVDDQRGRPSSAEHLARVSFALLDKNARGTLHVTDGGECSWFEFASEIVRLSGHACTVEPRTTEQYTAEFPRPAKRPPYSVLDLAPTEALVGPMTPWQENLADVMRRLEP
jgi:dTDP-4-dehydrorhamnose reductase